MKKIIFMILIIFNTISFARDFDHRSYNELKSSIHSTDSFTSYEDKASRMSSGEYSARILIDSEEALSNQIKYQNFHEELEQQSKGNHN